MENVSFQLVVHIQLGSSMPHPHPRRPTYEFIVINKPSAHLIEVGIFYEITIIRTTAEALQ